MKSFRQTANTTVIRYNDHDDFIKMRKEIGWVHLAQLTGMNQTLSAGSYIHPATVVKQKHNDLYIYDIACYNQLTNVFIIHKKLKIYYTERGGFYVNVRFGRAWINSFFDLPRNGINTAIIIPTEQVIKNEHLYY